MGKRVKSTLLKRCTNLDFEDEGQEFVLLARTNIVILKPVKRHNRNNWTGVIQHNSESEKKVILSALHAVYIDIKSR